jgi:hypothetical protein
VLRAPRGQLALTGSGNFPGIFLFLASRNSRARFNGTWIFLLARPVTNNPVASTRVSPVPVRESDGWLTFPMPVLPAFFLPSAGRLRRRP